MFDQFAAVLAAACLAVAYFEFLMGGTRRKALTARLIRWRDRLSTISIGRLPRTEAEFALAPLSLLAGWPTDDSVADRLEVSASWLDRAADRLAYGIFGAILPILRSAAVWGLILFGLIVLFREIRWKGPASGEMLKELLMVFPLAVTSYLSYWLSWKLLRAYDNGKWGPIVLIVIQVVIIGSSILALAYVAPLWTFLLLAVLNGDAGLAIASAAYLKAVDGINAAIPASSSILEQLLLFWPHANYGENPSTMIGSLLGASFTLWVRLGSLGILVFSWLLAPLTLRFALLNLRGLLELERPVLTTCAVAVSVVVKSIQELVKSFS